MNTVLLVIRLMITESNSILLNMLVATNQMARYVTSVSDITDLLVLIYLQFMFSRPAFPEVL